jgi:hypothetical protein
MVHDHIEVAGWAIVWTMSVSGEMSYLPPFYTTCTMLGESKLTGPYSKRPILS